MLEKLRGTFDKGIAAMSVKSETLVESSRFCDECGSPVA